MGKGGEEGTIPSKEDQLLNAQALCQELGLGSRELSLIRTPGGVGSRTFLE